MDTIARRLAPPAYAAALFASASLTFLMQPMLGRMVTPLLGGSPAVWNTSMVFFQAALLLGYVYAHALARLRDLRVQIAIHAIALALAWLVLPVHVSGALGPPDAANPALWLLGVLALSAGAPFAAASASAPLLQAWYARMDRADAHDPYYLYAASNLGSFAGLIAYPILVEPQFGLREQALHWSALYLLVAAGLAIAAALVFVTQRRSAEAATEPSPRPSWRQRFHWLAAAAIPSSLILSVTQHIATDVASAPFLWVLPLALYLLTFVVAFARGGERIAPLVLITQPVALVLLIASYFSRADFVWPLGANLLCFFLSALVCHLALARARPAADRLTEFYLWVSIGGVVGGALTALVAPLVFHDVYEYPLMLAAVALLRPRGEDGLRTLANASAAAVGVIALAALALLARDPATIALFAAGVGGAAALLAASLALQEGAPRLQQFAFLIAALLFALVMTVLLIEPDWLIARAEEEGRAVLTVRQPLGAAVLALAFLLLGFVVQAALKAASSLAESLALGVAMPSLTLAVLLLAAARAFNDNTIVYVGFLFAAMAFLLNRSRPYVLAGAVLAAFTIIYLDDRAGGQVVAQTRSFFGVLRVKEFADREDPAVPVLRVLMHGTTIHGAQLSGIPDAARRPLTYYNERTALGEAILAGLSGGETSRLALIGLGTGTTACLMRPSDALTIYEIDPAVVRLSMADGALFTYVRECQPDARLELGDARLRIAEALDGAYDVIVVDAFSSDAIPAHLLTREAVALYLRKTSERGIVVLHLSNRNLALVAEAVRVAHALDAPYVWRVSTRIDDPSAGPYAGLPASAMVLARSPETLAHLPLLSRGWRVLPTPPGRPWSDDYINLPRALLESVSGAEDCLQSDAPEECAR